MTKERSSTKPAAPEVFPEDAPFWEHCRKGELALKWCNACARPHFYPRAHCPHCGHGETEWRVASGRGRIYSYTRSSRAMGRVIAPAVIELDEGIRLMATITDADLHALRIGDEVRVDFGKVRERAEMFSFTTKAADDARRYAAAALKASANVRGLATGTPEPRVDEVSIVGAGKMGIGIALAMLSIGLRVVLVDRAEDMLAKARQAIEAELAGMVAKGRIDAAESGRRLSLLTDVVDYAAIAGSDLVIEAVWEQMALKKTVFADIERHARPDAILGTNTSTLDIDEIAGAVRSPERVVGLHFFSPAHVMKLIEIVRGPRTGLPALALSTALSRRLGKVPVVVGVCFGFVGNRLMIAREAQAQQLVLEGATPDQVDRVLTQFGLPMGTFELQDMAGGIELSWRRRQETGEANWLIDRLYEAGRYGRRVGKGYYRYEPGKPGPIVDPEVTALIAEASRVAGIERRALPDAEVLERLVLPMINEGAKLVEEGIVERAGDIDVVWQFGFGWPSWKGGPMHYADSLGAAHLVERLTQLQARHGDAFRPAALLERLAETGGRLTTAG